MLSRNEFEVRLAEHIHGELPVLQQREMAEYLLAHPEAARLEQDLRTLVEAGREVAGAPVPEGLVPSIQQAVSVRLHRQIDGEAVLLRGGIPRDGKSKVPGRPGEARPTRRWVTRKRGLAGIAVLAAALVLYLFAQEVVRSRAFAEALSYLQEVSSFQAKGTILAPGGKLQPFHMWLQEPYSYRVEIGSPGHRMIVVDKGGKRLIFSEKDHRYYVPQPGEGYAGSGDGGGISQLVEQDLRPPAKLALMPGVEKEDHGDTTRYVIKREGWTKRFAIEIDRPRQLLVRAMVMEKAQDQWTVVSDLSYSDFGVPLPDSLFSVEPPEGAMSLAETEAEQLWYERSLTTRSAIFPSALQTATMGEDYLIELTQPPTNDGVVYQNCAGGACECTASKCSILDIFRNVALYPVQTDDSTLQQQHISLKMKYRDGLSRGQRLAGLCELLGVTAVVTPWRDSLNTDLVFEQDSRPLPVSKSFFRAPPKTEVVEDGRVRFFAKRASLDEVICFVWSNSTNRDYEGVGIAMKRPEDPKMQDPFKTLIDLELVSSGRWAENRTWLTQYLGVTYRAEPWPVRVRHIQVSPGLPTLDGISSFSHYAAAELEDCYPNPASPATTIPFVLKTPADVVLRIFSGQGQLVRTLPLGQLDQGRHEVPWDGQDQAGQPAVNGIYLYRLEVDAIATSAKKVSLAR